jgi:hypothetical protein
MKSDKVPISKVPTLKFKRDELFRDFEDHPGRLALAREIKTIDDQIAELTQQKNLSKRPRHGRGCRRFSATSC